MCVNLVRGFGAATFIFGISTVIVGRNKQSRDKILEVVKNILGSQKQDETEDRKLRNAKKLDSFENEYGDFEEELPFMILGLTTASIGSLIGLATLK